MPQHLSVSRAARLAEVSRAELQKKIRVGEIATFEGKVAVSDLMRVFPDASTEDNRMLERVERIKANARPKARYGEGELPSAEVLIARLKSLHETLVGTKSALNAAEALLSEIEARVQALAAIPAQAQGAEALQLAGWLSESRRHLADQTDQRAKLFAKDTLLRIMAAHIKLIPSGHDFFLEGSETILAAAVRAGLSLNYGCSSGNCGSCKARVVRGEALKVREHDYVLSEMEKQMGFVLTCCNTAETDMVLEAAEAHSAEDMPRQEIRARVKKIEAIGEDLRLLHVETPRTQTLRFMAGQGVDLILENGLLAPCAIASCPCDGRSLQFVVRRDAEDGFAHAVFEQLRASQAVTIIGPHGDFVLIEDTPDPGVFVAFDDGFPPVRSLIEHAVSMDNMESIHLYWIVSVAGGHYMDGLCRSWRDSLDNFSYSPMVGAGADELLVRLVAEHQDLERRIYYLSGTPAQVEVLRDGLMQRGVDPERLRVNVKDIGNKISAIA